MKKQMYLFALVVLLTGLIAGCAAPAPAAQAPAPAEGEAAATAAPAAEGAAEGEAAAGAVNPADLEFVTVVKIAGINWFNRMEEGVQKFGEETGVRASLVGPDQADAALQIPMIEDLIAQGVDALCVVPMDPDALNPVLQKAMDAGITVVTHEASSQQSMHYDIEAFDNIGYGAHLMDHLGEMMGGEGEYAVFVGSLGSKTHNEWVDGGIARQQEAFPNMVMVGDKNETFDDSKNAYEKTKELLRAYPNIKGFQGSASTDVAGIGQAIEEAGLQDQTFVVGTSLPSIAGDLLESGAVDLISFWDPAVAGEACNQIALRHIQGETVGAGADLGLPGYDALTGDGNVLYGQAWVDVTAENMDEYPF
jgi:simple sugar transport system substrate-binding protein